jgi:nucleotide-binding universal stress UspA family protein/predicted transcriptional regulator
VRFKGKKETIAVFQHILVAIDGSENSLKAADVAIEFAALLQARLDILSIEEAPPSYVATREESSSEHSAAVSYFGKLHQSLRQKADRRGIQTQCAVLSGHEGQTILDYIVDQGCDLLVLGDQGHSGVWGAFLGSTADKLVSHASSSTLVVRAKSGKMPFKRIFVALDGSPLSWQAFQIGLQFAKLLHATLHTISVIEGPTTPRLNSGPLASSNSSNQWDWAAYFGQVQAQAQVQAQYAELPLHSINSEGHASSDLVRIAREENSDLLILGATGHEHPWSTTAGGTARKVANEASCAVLVVRTSVPQRKVRDLMSVEFATIARKAPIADVITLLIDQGVKLLVVVNEDQSVAGVITLGRIFSQGNVLQQLDLQRAASTRKLGQYIYKLFPLEQKAEDVMYTHPLVVKEDVSIDTAAHWMLSQHITRMPVVDIQGRLIGMLDQANLLHYYTDLPVASDKPAHEEPGSSVEHPGIVGEAVYSQVPLVSAETPLPEILRQVQTTLLRRVIVVNSAGKAIGVIADSDILASGGSSNRRNPIVAFAGRFALTFPEEMFRRRPAAGPLTAQQVMRPRLFAVTPTTSVSEAVRIMLSNHIKRLVVVDESGKPLGLVDRQQLLRSLVGGGV